MTTDAMDTILTANEPFAEIQFKFNWVVDYCRSTIWQSRMQTDIIVRTLIAVLRFGNHFTFYL